MKVIKLDNNIQLYYIEFIPRSPIEGDSDFIEIKVDTTLYTVDTTYITADMTIKDSTMDELINVVITDELTKEDFTPLVQLSSNNNIYKIVFLETNFLSLNSKYSLQIRLDNRTVYKGKMIFTNKDIQYYKYTQIINDKLYL